MVCKSTLLAVAAALAVVINVDAAAGTYYPPNDHRAVQLNTVQTLLFRKGSMTTGRRTAPVRQMTCVGGGSCGTQYEPDVVTCENIGVDYHTGDPNWKCTANLVN